MRNLTRTIATALAAMGLIAATAAQAAACGHGHPTPPPPTEVSVCWQIDHPDLTNPRSFEFPQTFVAQGDAQQTIDTLCPDSVPGCDGGKFQFDRYYLRDDSDRVLLAHLEDVGLNLDSHSRPEDTPLDPHSYLAKIVPGSGTDYNGPDTPGCGTPPPPPPPPHHPKLRHGYLDWHKLQSCAPSQRSVYITGKHGVVRPVHLTHNGDRTRWVMRAHTQPGFVIRHGKHGTGRWVHHVRWVIHLRDMGPCHAPPPNSQ